MGWKTDVKAGGIANYCTKGLKIVAQEFIAKHQSLVDAVAEATSKDEGINQAFWGQDGEEGTGDDSLGAYPPWPVNGVWVQ